MFVKVTIDISTQEGKEILRMLQNHPEVVTFSTDFADELKEPQPAYKTELKEKHAETSKNYKTIEEFEKEMHDFVAKQYAK